MEMSNSLHTACSIILFSKYNNADVHAAESFYPFINALSKFFLSILYIHLDPTFSLFTSFTVLGGWFQPLTGGELLLETPKFPGKA